MPRDTPAKFMIKQGFTQGPNALPLTNYMVTARTANAAAHGRKRFLVTYAYLAIINELVQAGHVAGQAQACGTNIQQASSPGNDDQAAHQVLGELQIGGAFLYGLPVGTISESRRRALLYINGAVSDIHKKYNYADNHIESIARPAFTTLANQITGGQVNTNNAIWDQLLEIFINAMDPAKARAQAGALQHPNSEQTPFLADILDILDTHKAVYEGLRGGHPMRNATIDQIVTNIEANAFDKLA